MNIGDDEMNNENKDSFAKIAVLAILFLISFAVTYYFLTKHM